MAIYDESTKLTVESNEHNFEFLKTGEDISSLIQRLVINIIDSDEKQLFSIGLERFAKQLHSKYLIIKSTNCKREFVAACKQRSEEVSDIISKLSVVADISNVSVVHNDNGNVIKLYCNEDVIWTKRDYYPKIYKLLIDLVIWVLKNNTIELNQKYEYLRVIASTSAIYNDIRPNKQEILNQEKEAIERLSQKPVLTSFKNFTLEASKIGTAQNELYKTIMIVAKLADSSKTISMMPNLYKDMVNAVRLMRAKFPDAKYDKANEPNYSFSSCGVYLKFKNGKSQSIPALLASAYEEDWVKEYIPEFDELTGFDLEYGQLREQVKGELTCFREISISIKQKKFARRVIHITNNCVQDRLNFFHRRIAYLLKKMQCDCTFNQEKGIQFIRNATKDKSHNIYCLDWSKATDTMLSEVQGLVIKELVLRHYGEREANILISSWMKLVKMQMTFKHINGSLENFNIESGQPQGFLSSFPSFALLHHIIMITNYRMTYGESVDPTKLYRVLGDDSGFLSIKRLKADFLKMNYIRLSNAVNVECSTTKGYTYEGNGSPIGEFAKVKCVNGVYFTNTPLNIVSRAGLSTEDALKYILWLNKYTDCEIDKDNLIEKLQLLHPVTKEEATVINHLLNSSLPNEINMAFNYRKPEFEELTQLDYTVFRRLLIESLNKSIIRSILPDGLREEPDEKQDKIGLSRIEMFKKLDLSNLEFNMKSKLSIIAFQDTFFSGYIEKFGYENLNVLSVIEKNDKLKSILTFATIKRFELQDYLDLIMEILTTEEPDESFMMAIHAVILDGQLERLIKSFNERSWSRAGKFMPDRFTKLYSLIKDSVSDDIILDVSEDEFEALFNSILIDLQ